MNHRHTFNVLREPWIPVIRLDSSRDELSILQCLEQSPGLREIRDPAPIIEFGLYRLMVAFVLDALMVANCQPNHWLDLQNLMGNGGFDMSMISNYTNQCGDVFDLFHNEKPFLQTKMDKEKAKPLAGMFPVSPSGTNVNHWHHAHEKELTLSSSAAARLLTTISPFMTAGGAGLSPSINGAPPIYALPVGKNLFQTIVLNIPLCNQDSGDGVAAWRSIRSPGGERFQATTVEALTWRPRKIQLVPEFDGTRTLVREMKFEKGDSTRLTWIDANVAYRYDKDKITPIRMQENRPLWRDAGPLSLLNESEHGQDEKKISFRRPDVVENAFSLIDTGDLLIQVYGMRTDMNMKIFEWAKSSWLVPAKLGRCTRRGSLVQRELDRSEKAAYALRISIKSLYPREGAGNKQALGSIVDRSERAYWLSLEPNLYPLMNAFAALDPNASNEPDLIKKTASNWREAIRNYVFQQFEFAVKDMDTDGKALERQVRARTRLNNTLRKVLS